MLNQSSLRAFGALRKGKVVHNQHTFSFLYFKVEDRDVTFSTRKKKWYCLCEHYSVWRGYKEEDCWHIRACRFFLEEKRQKNEKGLE